MPVRWRERVRRAAARAEEEERRAQRDLDEEMRAERAAREAAADLLGGGELAIDGRTGATEGEAVCDWAGEGSEAERGADGGGAIEVRAYEEGGEARGDEARPEPRLQPRRREGKGVFVSRKNRVRREYGGAAEGSRAAAEGAEVSGGNGVAGGEDGRTAGDGGSPGGEVATPGERWRYATADERSAARRRARIERKHARRAERLGAAAARREAEG